MEPDQQPRSYILRLWPAGTADQPTWRAMLLHPGTGQRWGFASLEQLFAYLAEQTCGDIDCDDDPEVTDDKLDAELRQG